jgi:hypothetical protein
MAKNKFTPPVTMNQMTTEIIKTDDKGQKTEWNESFYNFVSGITITRKYKGDRAKGPYEVDIDYPKNFKTGHEEMEERNALLPKSKRMYFNPESGEYVGYTRAYQLGLTK